MNNLLQQRMVRQHAKYCAKLDADPSLMCSICHHPKSAHQQPPEASFFLPTPPCCGVADQNFIVLHMGWFSNTCLSDEKVMTEALERWARGDGPPLYDKHPPRGGLQQRNGDPMHFNAPLIYRMFTTIPAIASSRAWIRISYSPPNYASCRCPGFVPKEASRV